MQHLSSDILLYLTNYLKFPAYRALICTCTRFHQILRISKIYWKKFYRYAFSRRPQVDYVHAVSNALVLCQYPNPFKERNIQYIKWEINFAASYNWERRLRWLLKIHVTISGPLQEIDHPALVAHYDCLIVSQITQKNSQHLGKNYSNYTMHILYEYLNCLLRIESNQYDKLWQNYGFRELQN